MSQSLVSYYLESNDKFPKVGGKIKHAQSTEYNEGASES